MLEKSITKEKITAFWLTPEYSNYHELKSIISKLSGSYNTSDFNPHITLYVSKTNNSRKNQRVLSNISKNFSPITLESGCIQYSNIFTKSLFLTFKESIFLNDIYKEIHKKIQNDNFSLDPHLSLLYCQLSNKKKKELSININIPSKYIKFNSVKLVEAEIPVVNQEDIKKWKELESIMLEGS